MLLQILSGVYPCSTNHSNTISAATFSLRLILSVEMSFVNSDTTFSVSVVLFIIFLLNIAGVKVVNGSVLRKLL
jgi:hypothetical protein